MNRSPSTPRPNRASSPPTRCICTVASKRHIIERGADYLLDRCRLLDPHTGTWAEQMWAQKGPPGLRVMQGLLHLAGKHPVAELERAAQIATRHSSWRLRDLKRLIQQPVNVVQLQFLETHPLIRPLDAYRVPLPANPSPKQTP